MKHGADHHDGHRYTPAAAATIATPIQMAVSRIAG